MRDVLPELMQWWEAGETIGVGTVVATFRSAPRPAGASMLVGPVMSRRRSVFSMPTSKKGRIVPLPIDTCKIPATCRKSSAMPPSGMYMTGSGALLAAVNPAGT